MHAIKATTHNRAGELALAIYKDVLAAIGGDRLIHDSVRREGSILHVQDKRFDLDNFERVFVCGCGKASFGMAKATAEILGNRVSGGLVITKHGHGGDVPGVHVLEASHPVPDETSLEAGRRMLEFAAQTGPNDLVLFALSGGASALMESLVDGVSLRQLQELNRALLAEGLDIRQMNSIRTRFSRLKGGKLAEAFAPSTVAVLVLSDVIGGSLETIGSGPFWSGASDEGSDRGAGSSKEPADRSDLGSLPSNSAYSTPLRLLLRDPKIGPIFHRLKIQVADMDSSESPPHQTHIYHRVIGSWMTAVSAAMDGAAKLALKPHNAAKQSAGAQLIGFTQGANDQGAELARDTLGPHATPGPSRMLREDARMEARRVAQAAKGLASQGADCTVFYGEPTVVIRGDGRGGRCQELATAVAPFIAGMEGIAILAGSTDGTDGPTDVGAAIVDGESVKRAVEKGITPEKALETSDSQSFLAACDGLIYTGPTQSNVNDIFIIVRHLG